MKELRRSLLIILREPVLTCRKAELAELSFLSGFSFTNIMIHRAVGKGGWLSLYILSTTSTRRHLDMSQVIAGYCCREIISV